MRARAAVLGIVAVPLIVVSGGADSAIYRCRDAAGNVLYADTACTGGSVVEIVESRPDPAAIERLKRDAEAYEARQARRDALALEQARAREQRALDVAAAQRAQQDELYTTGYYPGYYPGYYGGYVWHPSRAVAKPLLRPPHKPARLPPHLPASLKIPIRGR